MCGTIFVGLSFVGSFLHPLFSPSLGLPSSAYLSLSSSLRPLIISGVVRPLLLGNIWVVRWDSFFAHLSLHCPPTNLGSLSRTGNVPACHNTPSLWQVVFPLPPLPHLSLLSHPPSIRQRQTQYPTQPQPSSVNPCVANSLL